MLCHPGIRWPYTSRTSSAGRLPLPQLWLATSRLSEHNPFSDSSQLAMQHAVIQAIATWTVRWCTAAHCSLRDFGWGTNQHDSCRCRITKWQRRRTTAALAIAHTAEEADRVLLTSMYLAIGNSLQALPSQLGQLTMWRALVQVLRLALSGHVALHCLAICCGPSTWLPCRRLTLCQALSSTDELRKLCHLL